MHVRMIQTLKMQKGAGMKKRSKLLTQYQNSMCRTGERTRTLHSRGENSDLNKAGDNAKLTHDKMSLAARGTIWGKNNQHIWNILRLSDKTDIKYLWTT